MSKLEFNDTNDLKGKLDNVIENKEDINNNDEIIKPHKFNKSTTFMRSLLKLPLTIWDNTNFYNCYLSEDRMFMYLVFKKPFQDIAKFNYLLDTVATNKYYVNYVSNNNYSIIKCFIPIDYFKDVDTFIEGKYSEMSTGYKESMLGLYLRYNKNIYEILKKGLYPSNENIKMLESKLDCKLPNREVISICNIEEEIFDYKNFNLKEDI